MFYVLATPRQDHMARPNLMLVSDPGEGKTSFTRQVAAAFEIFEDRFVRWSIGQHDPNDANGWPTPRDEGLVFEPPFRIRKLAQSGGMWLLDEVGAAPAAVQAGFLKVLDEGTVGDVTLNTDKSKPVYIVGAMNPPESGAASQDTTRPFANRCVWVPFSGPTKDEHALYVAARGNMGSHLTLPARKPDSEWESKHALVAAIYSAWMRQPMSVLREDPSSDDVQARFTSVESIGGVRTFQPSYCTPRTWDIALQMAASALLYDDEAAGLDLVCGAIGRSQGLQFWQFLHAQDVIDGEVILAEIAKSGRTSWSHDVKRPDRTFSQMQAVAIAGCRAGLPDKERHARWHDAWRFVKQGRDGGVPKDLCLRAGQYLGENRVKGQLLSDCEAVIRELAPMVRATM
jgi:hypothetical protein